MNWGSFAQAAIDVLSAVLIVRLAKWRLYSTYRVFCAFLLFGILSSGMEIIDFSVHKPQFDYRIIWVALTIASWVVGLCMVFWLLQAILASFPGIRSFSRKLLTITFVVVVAVSLLSIRLDVVVTGGTGYLSRRVDPVGRLVRVAFDLDRVISTVAVLVLLVILAFVLWFPVQMPRNLAVLSVGFVVYFAANTALLLTRGIWSRETIALVSNLTLFIITACYAYWTAFITPLGEKVTVRMGHAWQPKEQKQLIGQLEAMNAALLRAARR